MEKSNAIEALTALAQEARLDVYRLLVRQGPRGMAAGSVAAELDIPAATLSFHLTTLRHAGLVEKRREGRQVFYSARFETISDLMGFLMENCCQDNPRACAFLDELRLETFCAPKRPSQ